MFIYKEKSESPELVIALDDAEIRADAKKPVKFFIYSTSHKNGAYEFKGSNERDRDQWWVYLHLVVYTLCSLFYKD